MEDLQSEVLQKHSLFHPNGCLGINYGFYSPSNPTALRPWGGMGSCSSISDVELSHMAGPSHVDSCKP
jgi:SCL-interrupting locus protein